MSQATTQLNVIVTFKNSLLPPGSLIHKTIMDHFASSIFADYAANRVVDVTLLQTISKHLTDFIRGANIRRLCGFSPMIAAICVDAKGTALTSELQQQVLFTIELFDE